MLPSRHLRPSFLRSLRPRNPQNAKRTFIAAPKPGDGPLMSRRSDRALPSIASSHQILKTFPFFLLLLGASTLAIFNYQKSSSSVVSSSMYALRVNALAREALGDEIYFRDRIPWIWGTIDQWHGRIDVHFGVKGTRQTGVMRFKSERGPRMKFFETTEWTLETDDGRMINLIEDGSADPLVKSEFGQEMAA